MCAIVDANVVGELWENSNSDAGKGFRRWVEESNGRLIVGGKLLQELNSKRATRWINRLALAGKLITVDDRKVNQLAQKLEDRASSDSLYCRSNDHHIIALARISGARLLYSNDRDLQQDFKNRHVINNPKGKVFSTLESTIFDNQRKTRLYRQKCNLRS